METLRPMGTAELVVTDEIRRGIFLAERISDDMSWAVGAITPRAEYDNPQAEHALVEALIDCIEEVTPAEQGMTGCTDGRRPLRLLDGSPVPARKQVVGGNLIAAFYMAEALGDRFYQDPTAPVEQRIAEVGGFLIANKRYPSGHPNCGMGANYAAVAENEAQFEKHPSGLFVARNKLFLPEGAYDEQLRAKMIAGNERRAADGTYDRLDPQMFVDAIEQLTGKHGLAELEDDGRGVHGHVEDIIARLRVGNRAVNEAKLGEMTGGREAFVVNDDELDDLARMFGRGNDEDYAIARMAGEGETNAGHGSLSKGLPTWRISIVG